MRNRSERLSALQEKLLAKGKSPRSVARRIDARNKLLDVGKGFGKQIAGVASKVISAVPGGVTAAKILNGLPIINEFPVAKEIAQVGAIQFELKVNEYGGVIQAVLSDLVPVLEDIREGEYLQAALSLAIVGAAVVAVIVINNG